MGKEKKSETAGREEILTFPGKKDTIASFPGAGNNTRKGKMRCWITNSTRSF